MAWNSSQPTLQTRRPSPTTVLYTVSTAPVNSSLAAKVAGLALGFVRIVIFSLCILYLYAKMRLLLFEADPFPASPSTFNLFFSLPSNLDHTDSASSITMLRIDAFVHQYTPAFWLAIKLPQLVYMPVAVVLAWACSRRVHLEESLLLIRGLGIQTSTSSLYYCFTPTTRFIPTPQIQDLFIHEAFRGFEVRYYLSVVVEEEEDAVVVFPKLLPRRALLEEVWRGAKKCLYESPKGS